MVKRMIAGTLQLVLMASVHAQTFDVDTLVYSGDSDKYINVVIMGDGYTDIQQVDFITDASVLADQLFTESPWQNYVNYFNVFAVRVISAASGTKHPNTAGDCNTASPLVPVSNPSTYLGVTFDSYGIHRLVSPMNTSNIVNVLSTTIPNYDQVLILANTPYYGGSGGNYATSTTETNSAEIVAHEVGHSFAELADEYWAGDQYAYEHHNMTQQTNASLVIWRNWMNHSGIGIHQYCCGGSSSIWYKPSTNSCKMQALGYPYCSVCQEAIVESIHSLTNVIGSYEPVLHSISTSEDSLRFALTELMKPVPNTLNIEWSLDGEEIYNGLDSIQLDLSGLTNGEHILVANVEDTTGLVRVDYHSSIHFSSVTWTIDKAAPTSIRVTSVEDKVTCSVYPNPTAKLLNISIDSKNAGKVSIQIASLQGDVIREWINAPLISGKFMKAIDIQDLARGTYFVVFKFDNGMQTLRFVKD